MDSVFYVLLGLAVLCALLVLALIVRARALALPVLQLLATAAKVLVRGVKSLFERARSLVPSREAGVAVWDQLSGQAEARYRAPRVVVLGHEGSGKSELLAALDAAQPSGGLDGAGGGGRDGFHVLDGGLAIELAAPGEARGAWWRTLRRLDDERPERALDAIVVSVSAEALLSVERARVLDVGRRIARQLRGLQHHLRLRLPVYLLVTKCDLVPGFSPFFGAVDGGSRQMFGWSNPLPPESDLEDGWCDSAFAALLARLQALELGIVAHGASPADAEAQLLFPRRVAALREAFATFVSVAFAATAYDFQGSLRGVYFAGRFRAGGPPELVADLFDQKIFAERNLAFCPERLLLSRSRVLRRFELTALAGLAALVVCLLLSLVRLGFDTKKQRAGVDALRSATPTFDANCPDTARLRDVLGNESLGESLGWYLAVPASFFDPRPTTLKARVLARRLLGEQVFPALHCRLGAQAAELAQPVPSDAALKSKPSPLERLAAIENWEQSAAVYARLAQDSPARYAAAATLDLTHLVQVVLDVARVPALSGNDELTHAALEQVTYDARVVPDLAAQRGAMARALLASTRSYRDRMLDSAARGSEACSRLQAGQGDPRVDLLALSTLTSGAAGGWRTATETQNPCSDLSRALRAGFVRLGDGRSGYPADTLNATLELLDEDACYRPVAAKFAEIQGTWCGQLLSEPPSAPAGSGAQTELAAVEQKALGLLGLEGKSQETAHTRALRELASASFMSTSPKQEFRCNASTNFNAAELAQARAELLSYQKLCETLGSGAETSLPGVRQRLFADVTQHVGRAQLGSGVPPSSGVARRFSVVAPDLIQIASLLEQLGAASTDAPWVECVNGSARTAFDQFSVGANQAFVLDAAEPAVAGAPLPHPRLLFQGLADASSANAKYELGLQTLRSLANEVRPFSNWYAAGAGFRSTDTPEEPAFVTTRDTLAALDAGTQNTTSPAARLASFYGNVLGGITDDNCAARLNAAAPTSGTDAFSLARVRLQNQANAACSAQAAVDLAARYESVTASFEGSLAGRFPFGPETTSDVGRDSVAAMAQLLAEPDTASLVLPANFVAQNAFLRNLRAGVALLQRFADGKTALGVSVAFRATPPTGRPTEDILSWQLQSGASAALFPNGGSRVSWHLGDAVSLSLRWANRSAFSPAPLSASSELGVIGRAALFSEAGDWALFRFIAAHRAPGTTANSPLLLRFDVDLDDADSPAALARASVAMRLTLLAADGSVVEFVDFPSSAPQLPVGTTPGLAP